MRFPQIHFIIQEGLDAGAPGILTVEFLAFDMRDAPIFDLIVDPIMLVWFYCFYYARLIMFWKALSNLHFSMFC